MRGGCVWVWVCVPKAPAPPAPSSAAQAGAAGGREDALGQVSGDLSLAGAASGGFVLAPPQGKVCGGRCGASSQGRVAPAARGEGALAAGRNAVPRRSGGWEASALPCACSSFQPG